MTRTKKALAATPAKESACAHEPPPSLDEELLDAIVEIEKLEDQQDLIQADIDERISILAAKGHDPKIIRTVLQRRRRLNPESQMQMHVAASHLADRLSSLEQRRHGVRRSAK